MREGRILLCLVWTSTTGIIGMGLALLIVSYLASGKHGLTDYVGRDLTKIKAGDLFWKLSSAATKETEKSESWAVPEPRWIKAYPIGSIRWLYLQIYPGYDVPDVSFVRAYGFD